MSDLLPAADAPGSGLLAQARDGRARVSTQLARLNATRPRTGADTAARASWLRDKADVHDQIAGFLSRIGDVAGSVEAEVLAARCRADARDLLDSTPHPGTAVARAESVTEAVDLRDLTAAAGWP